MAATPTRIFPSKQNRPSAKSSPIPRKTCRPTGPGAAEDCPQPFRRTLARLAFLFSERIAPRAPRLDSFSGTDYNEVMHRRHFLLRSIPVSIGLLAGPQISASAAARRRPELRITRIVVQDARGRRLTPVAPNAYAAYRGYDVTEPVLRVQTAQGLEGFCHRRGSLEQLRRLLGLDPFALFEWDGDVVRGPAEAHRQLLADLAGADIALFDLLGRALRRPVADLLGRRVRREVTIYDSSLYME